MDVSLADLLHLEPSLVLEVDAKPPAAAGRVFEGVEISWAVSARVTPPHLPQLRGGEVLLVPGRVVAAVGPELPALLSEAAARNVSAVVFDRERASHTTYPMRSGLAILFWDGDLSADTEGTINRLLTEWRGNLYRIGSDLERRFTDLAMHREGIGPFVRVVAESANVPITVVDAKGRVLASAPELTDALADSSQDSYGKSFQRVLPSGAQIVFGPLTPRERVTARFLAERISTAAAAALQRDDASRPRGRNRPDAVAALLTAPESGAGDRRSAALALGIDPDATFVVAVAGENGDASSPRVLETLGTAHSALGATTGRATLVEIAGRASSESVAKRVQELKRRWQREHVADQATLALSSPATGVTRLPNALQEARFVASIQSRPEFGGRAVSFDSVADIGALQLLYHLRESSELPQFVTGALGQLTAGDRRGTLRATLLTFLESGGSQTDAATRLGIHRNTLAYRLRRIGELVGRDVSDPSSWLTLHLALRASEVLESRGEDA
jgi:purine catabolism regulator